MLPDDLYQAWKHRRGRAAVPADFADRVMAAVQAQRRRSWLHGWLIALALSRWGRAGLCLLGCAACAYRLLQVVSVFFGDVSLQE